jgi:deazaflavin-dependent oxidoreductase (nitroreductase family)
MHLPRFLRRVNRHLTNPLMSTFAWLVPPLAVVHHVGRKSGRPYRTPVVAFRGGTGFVIPMTYGRDVDWARNLVSARGGEIAQMGQRFALARPRIVGFEEAAPHLPAVLRSALRAASFPGYVLLDFAEREGSTSGPRRRSSRSRRR